MKLASIEAVEGGFVVKWKDDSLAEVWENQGVGGTSLMFKGARPRTEGTKVFKTAEEIWNFTEGFFT